MNDPKKISPADNRHEKRYKELAELLSDQGRALAFLREIEARYHALVNAFKGYIYICSRDFRIEYMNRRFIDLVGQDGTGDFCYHTIHGLSSACPWCVNERVFNGETVQWEMQSPVNQRWYSIVNAPLYHPSGEISKYAMIIDISDRKRAEEAIHRQHEQLDDLVTIRTAELEIAKSQLETELATRRQIEDALRNSEEKYRLLIENATDGIVVTQDGKLQFFNPRVLEFSGATAEELLSEPFINYIHPDDREMVMNHHIRRLSSEEMPEPYIMRIVDSEEKTWWVENRGVLISWNGAPATLNFLSDITQRIEAENQNKYLSQQLLRAQENERLKISRDLHDSVAQDLSCLQIGLDAIIRPDGPDAKPVHEQVRLLSDRLKKAIADVRDLAHGLRPPSLDQLGLLKTVYQYCETFSINHQIRVDFYSAGMDDLSLGFEKEINIYRIIQESLSNVSKHAEADTVTVRMTASHPNIILRIQDNGKGFDNEARVLDTAMNRKRMGISSIMERAGLIGGTVRIETRPGRGTKLVIVIPIRGNSA